METREVVHLINIKSLSMKTRPTMKTYTLLPLVLLFLLPVLTFADIIPSPIQVKGIIPSHPINIQMVSEKVNVQLSIDSAWVECTFNMHNLSEAQDLEIGFPMMNFYLFQDKYPDQDKFRVWVNGQEIKKINMHIPEELQTLFKSDVTFGHNRLIEDYGNQNKPWYLWQSHFNKNESQVIIVKYILPNGANHQNRFFNYLLSTGAGWAGKIEKAEVNINIGNIPADQLISITPKRYNLKDKKISWLFKNLKPTTANDILVEYEMVKGSYAEEKKKADSIMYFVDDKKIKNAFGNLKPNDIASIQVNRNHPYEKYGAIYIYTNGYVLKNFNKKIKLVDREVWQQISSESTTTFANKYQLIVNNKSFTGEKFFTEIKALDTIPITKVSIRKVDSLKSDLIITTKE